MMNDKQEEIAKAAQETNGKGLTSDELIGHLMDSISRDMKFQYELNSFFLESLAKWLEGQSNVR